MSRNQPTRQHDIHKYISVPSSPSIEEEGYTVEEPTLATPGLRHCGLIAPRFKLEQSLHRDRRLFPRSSTGAVFGPRGKAASR